MRNLLRAVLVMVLLAGERLQPARAQGTPPSNSSPRMDVSSPRAIPHRWGLEIGRGRVEMDGGLAFSILQDGKVVGTYLRGNGRFACESRDRDEFPTIRITLQKNGGPEPVSGASLLSLDVPFREALFWHDGLALPSFDETPPSAEAGRNGFLALQSTFRKRGGIPLPQLLRNHQLNAAGTPWAILELVGPKGAWVFHHDPAQNREESFSMCFNSLDEVQGEGRSLISLVTVFERPLGRGRRVAPTPDLTLTHVGLDLHAPNERRLQANVIERFQIHRQGLRAITLGLQDRTYEVHRPTRMMEPHPYKLLSIKDGHGTALSFYHQNGILLVEFPVPLDPGAPLQLEFVLEGDILIQPLGDNYWVLGDGWFPLPEFHERAFTVDAKLRSKKPFLPLLPGDQISTADLGDEQVAHARIERPVQMYWALAGKYSTIQDTRNGQTVRVAAYALGGVNSKLLLDLGFDIIKFYEGFLGPFPFKHYLIAQVPQVGFGIAPPGLQLITSEAFEPFNGELTKRYTQGINHRIAHEVAHQYWPHVVHIPSEKNAWLSEAFAEYSSSMFIRASRGEGKFQNMVAGWQANAELAAPMAPLDMANRLSYWSGDPSNGRRYRNWVVYDKGALVLHAIRGEMGHIPFLKYLRALQLNFNGKPLSVEHLQGVLDAMTRKDHRAFFGTVVMGVDLPPK